MGKFKIATLIGSTSFEDEFLEVAAKLQLRGYLVMMPFIFRNEIDETIFAKDPRPKELKISMFKHMGYERIDLADLVVVVNPRGYIGESTEKEIDYAKSIGKPIEYLMNDFSNIPFGVQNLKRYSKVSNDIEKDGYMVETNINEQSSENQNHDTYYETEEEVRNRENFLRLFENTGKSFRKSIYN